MVTQTDRIQGLVGGVAFKAPCRVATTANITLSGEQVIDGIAAVDGDRVLVKDQTNGIENGIYDVSTSSWTRAPDWNGARDIMRGTLIFIIFGDVAASYVYQMATTDPIIGIDAITLTKVTWG